MGYFRCFREYIANISLLRTFVAVKCQRTPRRKIKNQRLADANKGQRVAGTGYDDSASEYYSWDSTVPNQEGPASEDKIVICMEIPGLEQVSLSILLLLMRKLRFRCPKCIRTNIKPRLSLRPRYRCHRGDCKHEFDKPISEERVIKTY